MTIAGCIGGVVPPICTPLTEEWAIDTASLVKLRARLIDGGVAGVFALGSTGEASYLPNSARREVIRVLSEAAASDGKPLLVGLVEPTVERIVEAASALVGPHVDAVVATGPFYASASPSEITAHFEAIARAVRVPILAYNIPSNVGYELPVEVVADLIRRNVIAGVKDSSANLAGLRQLILACEGRSDVAFFSGSDWLLDSALVVGANGSVAGLGNVAPELFVEALHAHREADARALARAQRRITILAGLYSLSDPGSGVNSTQLGSIKTALVLQGVIASDQLSRPMQRSTATKTQAVARILEAADVGSLSRVV